MPDPYLDVATVDTLGGAIYVEDDAAVDRFRQDDEDVILLAGQLGLNSADQVLDLVEQVGHPRLLTPQVELFVRSVMEPTNAVDPGDG